MAKYGICDRCKEPSILGEVTCIEEKPWMCPTCACEFFDIPLERVRDVKITLLEQYKREQAMITKGYGRHG